MGLICNFIEAAFLRGAMVGFIMGILFSSLAWIGFTSRGCGWINEKLMKVDLNLCMLQRGFATTKRQIIEIKLTIGDLIASGMTWNLAIDRMLSAMKVKKRMEEDKIEKISIQQTRNKIDGVRKMLEPIPAAMHPWDEFAAEDWVNRLPDGWDDYQ